MVKELNISVIIPVYNTEEYLAECVDSVLNQSFQSFEIILVDDGSTDSSGIICDKYAEKNQRIKVIHKKNGGQSAARNAAMDIATGKYVYFLDSDDYIGNQLLEKLYAIAEKQNADFVFFEAQSFLDDKDNKLYDNIQDHFEYFRKNNYDPLPSQEQLMYLLKNNEYYVCTPFHFYKKQYLDKNGIRFREGIIHEDNLFSAMVYLANGLSVHLPCRDYMRRLHVQSTMTLHSADYLLYKYKCMVTVYYETDKIIKKNKYANNLVLSLQNNNIDAVLRSYYWIPKKQKKRESISLWFFKQHVLFHYGKKDYQLARKCSGIISKPLIRGAHYLYNKINT